MGTDEIMPWGLQSANVISQKMRSISELLLKVVQNVILSVCLMA